MKSKIERLIEESMNALNLNFLYSEYTVYEGAKNKNYPAYASHLYGSLPEIYAEKSRRIDPISPEDAVVEYFFKNIDEENGILYWKVIMRKHEKTKYEVIAR